jgi:hypothetical protein
MYSVIVSRARTMPTAVHAPMRTTRVLFSGVRSGVLHSGQWTLARSQRSMHRRWTPSAVSGPHASASRAEPGALQCGPADTRSRQPMR